MINSKELKILRKSFKFTQAEMAEKLGVSRVSYLRWENGQLQPHPRHARKIDEMVKSVKNSDILNSSKIDSIEGVWVGYIQQYFQKSKHSDEREFQFPVAVIIKKGDHLSPVNGNCALSFYNQIKGVPLLIPVSFQGESKNDEPEGILFHYLNRDDKGFVSSGEVSLFRKSEDRLCGTFSGLSVAKLDPVSGIMELTRVHLTQVDSDPKTIIENCVSEQIQKSIEYANKTSMKEKRSICTQYTKQCTEFIMENIDA